MHKARRSVCKQWWNAAWRDRLLAFCAQLTGDAVKVMLPTGGGELRVSSVPMRFMSPWTYYEDGGTALDETAEIELMEDADEADEEENDTDE